MHAQRRNKGSKEKKGKIKGGREKIMCRGRHEVIHPSLLPQLPYRSPMSFGSFTTEYATKEWKDASKKHEKDTVIKRKSKRMFQIWVYVCDNMWKDRILYVYKKEVKAINKMTCLWWWTFQENSKSDPCENVLPFVSSTGPPQVMGKSMAHLPPLRQSFLFSQSTRQEKGGKTEKVKCWLSYSYIFTWLNAYLHVFLTIYFRDIPLGKTNTLSLRSWTNNPDILCIFNLI